MDVDVQSNSTVDNRPEMHSLTKDPIEDNTRMDTDEQESTLLDVRETIETFTTDQTMVSSTPPSHNTQQYEPQTMLGKQVVQLLEDKRLTHKFDKLRVAAKECEKGDRTYKRYERAAAKVKQALIEEYNRQDSEFKSWQNGYIASEKKYPNPEDIPPEIALAMRKRKRISTIVYHEWKLKLS